MKYLIPILLLFIIGCGTTDTTQYPGKDSTITIPTNDSLVIVIPPFDTLIVLPPIDSTVTEANRVIIYTDTVFKTKTLFNDTVYKTKVLFTDTLYKQKIIRVPITVYDTVIEINYTYIDSIVPVLIYDTIYIHDTVVIPPIDTTIQFGLMQATDPKEQVKQAMIAAGVKTIRLPFYFYKDTVGQVINAFLNDGFNVQISFNWKNTSSPVTFPKDTNMIRQKARAFFQYYLPKRNQIPFVSVENEWDNYDYRDWANTTIQDYITELNIVCDEGHKYGFKISDGGLTGNNLGRWTYSHLSSDSALWWKSKYFVGTGAANYNPMLKLLDDFSKFIRFVNIDFLNTHWYNNNTRCSEGYSHAFDLWAKFCGKENLPRVNNEFGMRDGNMQVWKCTIQEMKDARIIYAIAYSGDGSANTPAQRLTHEYLLELK